MFEPLYEPSLLRFPTWLVAISTYVSAWLTRWTERRQASKALWRAIRAA